MGWRVAGCRFSPGSVRAKLGARVSTSRAETWGCSPIVLFYLATFLFWASLYVYMPILAVHSENLGASMALVGTIVGAYGFSQLVLRIPIGVWSDRIGVRRPFIVAGMVASALAALGFALSSDPTSLVGWRAISGVAAAVWVPFIVLFSSYYAPEKTTRAIGNIAFVGAGAETIASYAGGYIAQYWGWRAPFWVALALATLGMAVALRLPEKPLKARRDMGFREISRIGTTPLLVAVSIVAALSSWTQWVTVYGFSPVYAARLGADRAELGTLTAAMQLANTAGTFASAYLAERIGSRTTIVAGLAIQSASALMVPWVGNLPMMALSQVLGGIGRALPRPVLMAASIESVPAADRATAMGVFQAVYSLGMFMGPASTGVLGDAVGLSSVFFAAGLMPLVGIAVVASRVPAKKQDDLSTS